MNADSVLKNLLNLSAENEVVEFKEAKNSFDFTKLGKYFSALSNEANLMHKDRAWLVFGVNNSRQVGGSCYRSARKDLDSLKEEVAKQTTNRISFVEIHEVEHDLGRVILFEIPAAPKGMPVAFGGHYYGREGSALSALSPEEYERMRSQITQEDWSAVVELKAGIDDLDEEALVVARKNFKSKFPDKASEVDGWDNVTFLNKARLTTKGRITRAALLLLGREESEHFLQPADPKVRWLLKDHNGNDRDYALFGLPLLLAVDKLYSKIRNLKYRYIREGTLFPEEIDQYEPYSIREALNNCIAHQDYTLAGRINVVEREESLTFTNLGNFVPGDVERVVIEDAPEEHYRNRFLATAMFNLKMVDTAGGGIRKMFLFQRQRFFPMPDYVLSEKRVKVTLTGKVLDMDYSRLLASNGELTLQEIIALDKVQKGLPLNDDDVKSLRKKKLIEGRKSNLFVSSGVAKVTGHKAAYIHARGQDDEFYAKLIMDYLKEFDHASRKDIDDLLCKKLSDAFDEDQKKVKISNLLTNLRRKGAIVNVGTRAYSRWRIAERNAE